MSKSASPIRRPAGFRGLSLVLGSASVRKTAAQTPIGSGFVVGTTVTAHGCCALAPAGRHVPSATRSAVQRIWNVTCFRDGVVELSGAAFDLAPSMSTTLARAAQHPVNECVKPRFHMRLRATQQGRGIRWLGGNEPIAGTPRQENGSAAHGPVDVAHRLDERDTGADAQRARQLLCDRRDVHVPRRSTIRIRRERGNDLRRPLDNDPSDDVYSHDVRL